jgi:hypothetical protein
MTKKVKVKTDLIRIGFFKDEDGDYGWETIFGEKDTAVFSYILEVELPEKSKPKTVKVSLK